MEPDQLFENGYVNIATAMFKLRKEGKHQEAYDGVGYIITLLMEIRQDIRKTANIEV